MKLLEINIDYNIKVNNINPKLFLFKNLLNHCSFLVSFKNILKLPLIRDARRIVKARKDYGAQVAKACKAQRRVRREGTKARKALNLTNSTYYFKYLEKHKLHLEIRI